MPIYIQFSSNSRALGGGKGRLQRMAYGSKIITPNSLDLSLLQIASESTQPTSHASGGRHHSPIVITKEVDSASPLLWQACHANEALPSLDLTLIRSGASGGTEQVVSTITLTNATISKVNQFRPVLIPPAKKPKHGLPSQQIHTNELEEFQLVFQKITYTNVSGKKSASDDWNNG